MENLLLGRLNNNISDELLSSLAVENETKSAKIKSLSYFTNAIVNGSSQTWFGIGDMSYNSELSDKKVRKIAQKLAKAVDSNSVEEVKRLKEEFRNEKEFVKAKKFLNDKCKQIWNVYDNPTNVPKAAMKSLGITNQPTLEFLLDNCVKYFEKDGGNATAKTIESILNNKNMDYTIEDICKYLIDKNSKEGCNYNPQTVKYLIQKHDYDVEHLIQLGVSKDEIKEILKSVPLKQRVKYSFKNFHALIK